jgi:macrolide-specific efflux system membrane fusion protein
MKKIVIIVLAFFIVIIGAGVFYYYKTHNTKNDAASFEKVTVNFGSLRNAILASGTVKPQNRVEVKTPIAGRVEKILVEEGDVLNKGDILAWMSSTERAALLDAARARGSNEVAYWEQLYKPTPLVAPISGQLIVRNIEEGQTVSSADVLFVMSDRLIFQAQVDETDISRIKQGQRVEMTLDAYPDVTMEGVVDRISYEAKTVNNVTMYYIDVLPSKLPPFVKSGMTANLYFIVSETNNVLYIPLAAIIKHDEKNFVYVQSPYDELEPEMVSVITGFSDGKSVEIREGLTSNEVVLIKKAHSTSKEADKQTTSPFLPTPPRRR